METSQPKLTAHRGDTDEHWRIERLRVLLERAARLIKNAQLRQIWHGAIVSMHDHKGHISVGWRSVYDHGWFQHTLTTAWASLEDYRPIKHLAVTNICDPRLELGIGGFA